MIIGDRKKHSAGLILSMKFGDKKKEEEAPDEESDSGEGLKAAAEEILAAVKAGDATALESSLKSFFDICSSGDEPVEEEPEEG